MLPAALRKKPARGADVFSPQGGRLNGLAGSPTGLRILSWNLHRLSGARLAQAVDWIRSAEADVVCLQEADPDADWAALLHRPILRSDIQHAPYRELMVLAVTDPEARLAAAETIRPKRILQLADIGSSMRLVHAHLYRNPLRARFQLREAIERYAPDILVGDLNLPVLDAADHAGMTAIAPSGWTHRLLGAVPLTLDRCLIRSGQGRGRTISEPHHVARLSDHRPVIFEIELSRAVGAA